MCDRSVTDTVSKKSPEYKMQALPDICGGNLKKSIKIRTLIYEYVKLFPTKLILLLERCKEKNCS